MVETAAVVEITVVVETEEDINILFSYKKKRDNVNCPFFLILEIVSVCSFLVF
jgi:hypothetical protein